MIVWQYDFQEPGFLGSLQPEKIAGFKRLKNNREKHEYLKEHGFNIRNAIAAYKDRGEVHPYA